MSSDSICLQFNSLKLLQKGDNEDRRDVGLNVLWILSRIIPDNSKNMRVNIDALRIGEGCGGSLIS
jgi:hypothetical protein